MGRDFQHGGALDRMRAAFPNAPQPWLDLSTGINPWPYPIGARSEDQFQHLPDTLAYRGCADALAQSIGAPASSVLLSPGSELLIRLLPLFIKAKRVSILAPTYGDYREVWTRAGCDVIETSTPLDHASDADVIVVCNPNNPDGKTFAREQLVDAHRILRQRNGTLIVDEAYGDLAPDLSLAALGGSPGLVVLRSLGKFYGLAGVRLGAALLPADLHEALSGTLGAWPVSNLALELGQRAYADTAWRAETRAHLMRQRGALDTMLSKHVVEVAGGTDLFRYVRIEQAHTIWAHLAQNGIYVRKFEHSNEHLRIGLPASAQDFARLDEVFSLSV